MKPRTILLVAIALAASYPLATGDFRLVGLKYRMQAFGQMAAEHSARIGKDVIEFIGESQAQAKEAATASDRDALHGAQDKKIHGGFGPLPSGSVQTLDFDENGEILPNPPAPEGTKRLSLSTSSPLVPGPKSDIDGATTALHTPASVDSFGDPGRFQVISSSAKFPPVIIDTRTGVSWFLKDGMDRRDWTWAPIQHEDGAAGLPSMQRPVE